MNCFPFQEGNWLLSYLIALHSKSITIFFPSRITAVGAILVPLSFFRVYSNALKPPIFTFPGFRFFCKNDFFNIGKYALVVFPFPVHRFHALVSSFANSGPAQCSPACSPTWAEDQWHTEVVSLVLSPSFSVCPKTSQRFEGYQLSDFLLK